MEQRITVQMTKETLFDFLLYHTYSKLSGFLVNVLGLAVFILGGLMIGLGKIETYQFLFYFLAAAVFLSYTPLQLKRRAAKQMEVNPEYRDEKDYIFSEEGIKTVQGEKEKLYTWEKINRTVTTPKTIGFYYGKEDALIIPKQCFGDKFMPILEMTITHIGRQNVRLR